jgi:hypothetical protein
MTYGHPAPLSDRKTARYPAEIRMQRTCAISDMRPHCAVFRSENGTVSRRDPDAAHMKYVKHAAMLLRVPTGKRRGIPQRSAMRGGVWWVMGGG